MTVPLGEDYQPEELNKKAVAITQRVKQKLTGEPHNGWLVVVVTVENHIIIVFSHMMASWLLVFPPYRRPTMCSKKILFWRFQGDCEFSCCVLVPPGLIPTYIIV